MIRNLQHWLRDWRKLRWIRRNDMAMKAGCLGNYRRYVCRRYEGHKRSRSAQGKLAVWCIQNALPGSCCFLADFLGGF